MNEINIFQRLEDEARQQFEFVKKEIALYGIEISEKMEIRRAKGMEYYYDLSDGHIYIANLDLTTLGGKLTKIFLKSLLKCETDQELFDFLLIFQGHVIAHELAHHLRHTHGVFNHKNLWEEEQIANHFAKAVNRRFKSPRQQEATRHLLLQAIENISRQITDKNIAVDTYQNFTLSLNMAGILSGNDTRHIETLSRVTGYSAEQILQDSSQSHILQHLEQRKALIQEINDEYTSDMIRYMYYHLNWIYYDLNVSKANYIDEFLTLYLKRPRKVLPRPFIGLFIDEKAIRACYKAYQSIPNENSTLQRYFYKRYRALLIKKLGQIAENNQNQSRVNVTQVLGTWDGSSEILDYLALFGPQESRHLFPNTISQMANEDIFLPSSLPTESDKALWKLFAEPEAEKSEAARNTLQILAILDTSPIFRELPVEVLLEIIGSLYTVKVRQGERVLWCGEHNHDIYIVLSGELKVGIETESQFEEFARLKAGSVFGEMAFLTKQARNADVLAVADSEIAAFKEMDLQMIAHRYPAIMMQFAVSLAQRLNASQKANTSAQADQKL